MPLKWDGSDEPDDDEIPDADDELVDVRDEADVQTAEARIAEETESQEDKSRVAETPDEDPRKMEDPNECEHPWDEVTQETMKRVVRGSTIDTKDIYWCDSCKSILDVIE